MEENHPVRVRAALPADMQEVKKLLRSCELPVDGIDEQFTEGCCVAEAGSGIIGVAGIEIHGSFGLLRSVAVTGGSRGRMVGYNLVKNRLAWCASKNLSEVFLLTTSAARFFERFGFQQIDRTEVPTIIKASSEFSSICPDTATVMKRPISGSVQYPMPQWEEEK